MRWTGAARTTPGPADTTAVRAGWPRIGGPRPSRRVPDLRARRCFRRQPRRRHATARRRGARPSRGVSHRKQTLVKSAAVAGALALTARSACTTRPTRRPSSGRTGRRRYNGVYSRTNGDVDVRGPRLPATVASMRVRREISTASGSVRSSSGGRRAARRGSVLDAGRGRSAAGAAARAHAPRRRAATPAPKAPSARKKNGPSARRAPAAIARERAPRPSPAGRRVGRGGGSSARRCGGSP